jgi:peptidylprolyl isomerase
MALSRSDVDRTPLLRGRIAACAALVGLAASVVGCGSSSAGDEQGESGRTTTIAMPQTELKVPPFQTGKPPKHLIVKNLKEGKGVEAQKGDLLTVAFVTLSIDGKPFESTWDPGERPFSFHLGEDEVSPGWEQGLQGIRVGEARQLIIPGEIASRYAKLPHEQSYVYAIEAIGVRPPELDERKEPDVKVPAGKPPSELQTRDLIEGSGPVAKPGDIITMNYKSRHYTGEPWSNSWDDGHPFRIRLGAHTFKSIPGWEEGIPGMRVGGRREIIVPPDLIYQGGAKPDSKPSETLVYIVDLYGVTEPPRQRGG